MTADTGPTDNGQELLPSYGPSFLEHHAGRIIADPEIALVELVANCWDAGADAVEIAWPAGIGGTFSISDNGIGMSRTELEHRWMTLNYSREEEQGRDVLFPSGVRHRKRLAFGRNGVGRHATFCFADEYLIDTRKDGRRTAARVRRTSGRMPYSVSVEADEEAQDTGTVISTVVTRLHRLTAEQLGESLGTRFVVDPEFRIRVNGSAVTLTDIESISESQVLDIEGVGTVIVRRIDAETTGRSSKHHGIAWWVQKRLVGAASWEGQAGPLLDSRRASAKRYTYVVEADVLKPHVKKDWTGFHASPPILAARRVVEEFVTEDLRGLLHDVRRERKRVALEQNVHAMKALSPISQDQIAAFVEEIQVRCPTIGERELADSVQVLAKLESARSGYALLGKLARFATEDFDGLNTLLTEWTVSDAQKVLGELRYRLSLIQQLEKLVDDHQTDELHDLQPLFERGLWMFGPEFEALDFTSNRSLATVVEKFFGEAALRTPKKRPDFVALPDSSIGVYSRDSFDERHEVGGFGSIVIVELKRGGFSITDDEKDQATKYARELRRSGRVGRDTPITAYVLGSVLDAGVEDGGEGKTRIIPRTYSVVLRQAHARTFNLLRVVELSKGIGPQDPDVREIVNADQMEFADM